MNVIITGCGRVGAYLAGRLSQSGHNVTIIDSDQKSFDKLGNGFNGMPVTGIPIDEDVLKLASIETADAVCAVTPDDNMNIMIAQISRQLYHVPVVITRTSDPEREEVLKQMGLDTLCATTLAVERLETMLEKGRCVQCEL
ncbi:MAG: TrkA family potassium uptake protein [Angelakisella sp.]